MTEEEKRLLFQDLVARVPYGVKGKTLGCKTCTLVYIGVAGDFTADTYHGWIGRKQFVPYLRPMSDMTEDEFKEWHDKIRPMYDGKPYESEGADIDFFNKHHIDYRNLIEKGLALKAPDGMYDDKNN